MVHDRPCVPAGQPALVSIGRWGFCLPGGIRAGAIRATRQRSPATCCGPCPIRLEAAMTKTILWFVAVGAMAGLLGAQSPVPFAWTDVAIPNTSSALTGLGDV